MKSVVICASKKYKEEVQKFVDRLRDLGVIVYDPNINKPTDEEDHDFRDEHTRNMVFLGLTLEHFRKERKADVCFIYNQNDYMGVSTTLELGYAVALDMPIYALSPRTGDPCRDALIDAVCETPEELIKYLK